MRNVLLLPIGGNASRMRGIPKFLLPISGQSTLIESHIKSALDSGYDEVLIIVNQTFAKLVSEFLGGIRNVRIVPLKTQTVSMCETILMGLVGFEVDNETYFSLGLADTFFVGEDMKITYQRLLNSSANLTLGLFKMREDQVGKLGQVAFSRSNQATKIVDKEPEVISEFAWGLAKFHSSFLSKIYLEDAHVGISFQKWLGLGEFIEVFQVASKYYDCGTFLEYSMCIRDISM